MSDDEGVEEIPIHEAVLQLLKTDPKKKYTVEDLMEILDSKNFLKDLKKKNQKLTKFPSKHGISVSLARRKDLIEKDDEGFYALKEETKSPKKTTQLPKPIPKQTPKKRGRKSQKVEEIIDDEEVEEVEEDVVEIKPIISEVVIDTKEMIHPSFFIPSETGIYTIEDDGLYFSFIEKSNIKKEICRDPFFKTIVKICSSGDEFFAISSTNGNLYSINPENGKFFSLGEGYDHIIHMAYCKGKVFSADNFGFIYSFDLLAKKASQVNDEPIPNIKGLGASNDKLFILNSQ